MPILSRAVVRPLLLLLAFWCGGLTRPAAHAREPLWVVEKGDARLYLLGSLHVLPKSVSPARPALLKALRESNRVFFEIANLHGSEMETFCQRHGFYPPSDRLERHLTPDAKNMVKLVLPLFDLRWQDVQNHKPWLLGLRLQQALVRSRGFAAAQGVDEYFEALARKQGKPIGGLESIEEHLGLFLGLSEAEQNAALISDIEGLVSLHRDLKIMGRMWQQGDTDFFARALADQQETKSGQRLFRDRNRRWIPRLVNLLESGEKALVIVGLGHMVGRDGVVTLLRARGYAVRQL